MRAIVVDQHGQLNTVLLSVGSVANDGHAILGEALEESAEILVKFLAPLGRYGSSVLKEGLAAAQTAEHYLCPLLQGPTGKQVVAHVERLAFRLDLHAEQGKKLQSIRLPEKFKICGDDATLVIVCDYSLPLKTVRQLKIYMKQTAHINPPFVQNCWTHAK
jgi:hypothetical protein